jgi:hypothetical protein
MLTLKEFNRMSVHNQEEAIWSGTFLADREESGLIVRLYSLNIFTERSFIMPLRIRYYA